MGFQNHNFFRLQTKLGQIHAPFPPSILQYRYYLWGIPCFHTNIPLGHQNSSIQSAVMRVRKIYAFILRSASQLHQKGRSQARRMFRSSCPTEETALTRQIFPIEQALPKDLLLEKLPREILLMLPDHLESIDDLLNLSVSCKSL